MAIPNNGPKWISNWTEKKIPLPNRGEILAVTLELWICLERTGEHERLLCFFTPHTHILKSSRRGRFSAFCLHRPLVCDLWFTVCPDVPSRKDTSAIVLIMLLFAVSFQANYPLASCSPWSQVRLGKQCCWKTLEFIPWKCKSNCPHHLW